MIEESDSLRWITAHMHGRDGRLKPIGVWISNEDDDIFGEPDDGSDWTSV